MRKGVEMLDYVVIGAGPAGVQLAFFMEKAGRDYLVLERGRQAGTFFQTFPRSRQLISYNRPPVPSDDAEIQMRFDWNSLLTDGDPDAPKFRNFDKDFLPKADNLVTYLDEFTKQFDLNINYETSVVNVAKSDDVFTITDQNGATYQTRNLIIATGGVPYIPDIKGIDLATDDYSTVSMNPADYEGQRVLIIGKGNSAFEVLNVIQNRAMISILMSPTSLRLAWQTKHSGHARSTLIGPLDAYQLKAINCVILDADINEIRHNGSELEVDITYSHAEGDTQTDYYDRIITCTGFKIDTSIFDDDTKPDLIIDDRFPALTNTWESENVENLYFAGTLTQGIDFQKAASTFIGGFRHNAQALFNVLEEKNHDVAMPRENLSGNPDDMARHIAKRLTMSSALFFQFDFLADVLVYENGKFEYYSGVMMDYAKERFANSELVIIISFLWGQPDNNNVLSFQRRPTREEADASVFVHPILRAYSSGEKQDEQHILEDIYGCYVPGSFDRFFTKSHGEKRLGEWHNYNQVDVIQEFVEKRIAALRKDRAA
ncbi:NAD(P)-binding domain-containing protein [Roseibium sp. RKSG952]|uniref:NAD(P)-binding domain-containing protein n=1 Tax=Roseibium sp. RKSG952 TaxID=2529384 RepID=UPI0012BC7FCA|nr:NAD(P)-binding domain-containing protein [Roseibium sp. RKSG952]MTH95350.1 pyridine nucleotide-disulfide oxidoreductase [Roseibium sp. RKSG952]